jgi:hypothetical protein
VVFDGLLWRRKGASIDLAGAGSLRRAGCSDAMPVASTYKGFRIGGSACPSTLLAQVRYVVPDVAMRCQSRRRIKDSNRRKRLSVDLASASSLPRAGCSDAMPVASTYKGFRIGGSACPSTLLAQVRYLVPDVCPLAYNFNNHAQSSALAHQHADGISAIRPHESTVVYFLYFKRPIK